VLAPEVVLVSDGGGVKQAALRPITGAERVVRAFGGYRKADGTFTVDPTMINGNPGLVVRLDGEIDGVMAIRVEDARITGPYYVRNPEKLRGRHVITGSFESRAGRGRSE
jgi:RNA polymerase sigma-70 factor, ECF subfamily